MRRVDELEVGQRPGALLAAPTRRTRSTVGRCVRSYSARNSAHAGDRPPGVPSTPGDVGIAALHLQRIAGHDPHERRARGHQRREAVDVVLDDHVRLLPVDDLAQLRLAVHRAVDQRLPRRLHEGCELLDRRLAELGRRVADEVDPELTRVLGLRVRVGLRRRRQIDEILDEPERLQPAVPRRLGREHDAVAALAQGVADADAVVRRAVGRSGMNRMVSGWAIIPS